MRMKSFVFLPALVISAGVLGSASSAKADAVKIMSRAACIQDISKLDVGHTAIAFYDSSGKLLSTKGMWPDEPPSAQRILSLSVWPGRVRTNDSKDQEMARGIGCSLRTRTAYVTRARRVWLEYQVATQGGTNCQSYLPVGKYGGSDKCSCVNFGTRVWRQVTEDQERWQFELTPKTLSVTIWSANGRRDNGVFNNGNFW